MLEAVLVGVEANNDGSSFGAYRAMHICAHTYAYADAHIIRQTDAVVDGQTDRQKMYEQRARLEKSTTCMCQNVYRYTLL